jgi:hypothetical protein
MFHEFKKRHNLKPKDIECNVKSDELGVAGTLDFAGECDGKFMVIDWKTAKSVYDNYYLQISAYSNMYKAMHPEIEIDCGAIVCIRDGKIIFRKIPFDENSSIKDYKRETLKELFPVYASAVNVFRWKYNMPYM